MIDDEKENQMATNDLIRREVLRIPDRKSVTPTTYDAKDPDTKFPPITPLRRPRAEILNYSFVFPAPQPVTEKAATW